MGKVFVYGMAGLITIGLIGCAILIVRLSLWKPKKKEERSAQIDKAGQFCPRCGDPVFSSMFHRC